MASRQRWWSSLPKAPFGRLRRWARREGVEPAALAARLLTEVIAEPDPFDFIGSYASEAVAARDADTYLAEHGQS